MKAMSSKKEKSSETKINVMLHFAFLRLKTPGRDNEGFPEAEAVTELT